MNFGFEVALIKTTWGEPDEVKVSRPCSEDEFFMAT